MSAAQVEQGHRSDIEGLRAVAILLVMAFHVKMPALEGGFIGVDVFFVLSGYLITSILVREIAARGKLDFVNFYIRRARRLLPGLYLVLVATLLAAWLVCSPAEQRYLAGSALATALYVSNLWFAREATDYLAADSELNPLLHTWSLSVEEQFYIVWPLAMVLSFILCKRYSAQKKLLFVMGALGVVSLVVEVMLTRTVQPWAFFLSPARAWEFAIGGITATLATDSRLAADSTPMKIAGWAGLAVILGAAVVYTRSTTFPGFAALAPCLGTAAVLYSGARNSRTASFRLLSTTPLQWIGRHSYSWYLWHWPVLVIASVVWEHLQLWHRIALAGLSLGLAVIAYRLVENPIRTSRWLADRRGISVAMAAGSAVFMTVLIVAWGMSAQHFSESPLQQQFTRAGSEVPEVYRAGCHLEVLATQGPECYFGNKEAGETVVLFGDSHAAQWFPAIERAAVQNGLRLFSATKSECPAPSVPFESSRLGRTYDECDRWRASVLAKIRELKPVTVFVASSYQYPIAPAQWADGLQKTLAEIAQSGARIVLLRDPPRSGINVPTCLARQEWTKAWSGPAACTFELATAMNQEIYRAEDAVAKRVPRVWMTDLTPHICESPICQPMKNGVVKFRDSNHLTVQFVDELAPLFGGIMNRGP